MAVGIASNKLLVLLTAYSTKRKKGSPETESSRYCEVLYESSEKSRALHIIQKLLIALCIAVLPLTSETWRICLLVMVVPQQGYKVRPTLFPQL